MAKICPDCKREFDDTIKYCLMDGTLLPSTDEVDPIIGAVFKGTYKVVRRLGVGGMGAVYLAEQLNMARRKVAIKILQLKFSDDPEFVERFNNEAVSTSRISSTSVITIYDRGLTEDGSLFIAMEYVEGKTVSEVLHEEGAVPAERAIDITKQVCRALIAAHKIGIVHRDIKPDNIMLIPGEEGEVLVKVLDFGISKLKETATHTQTGLVLGTPHYMSPEQAQGLKSEELDGRSDVYSLGVVLYEMLTGAVPFTGDTPMGILLKHLAEKPVPIRTFKPELKIPAALEAVVSKALEKDREKRQQDAGELLRELDEVSRSGLGPEHTRRLTPVDLRHARAGRITTTPAKTPSAQVTVEPIPVSSPTPTPMPTPTPFPMPAATPARRIVMISVGVAVAIVILLGGAGWFLLSQRSVPATTTTQAQRAVPTAPEGMVYVPGGTFMMGSEIGEIDEKPLHSVTVAPFFMDKTEVTNLEYKKFVDATGHPAPKGWTGNTYPPGTASWPVTSVPWSDAFAYAAWAGKRLPTEAEWEYAARGPEGRIYPWGSEWKPGAANTQESKFGRPQAVASYPEGATPLGILDLAGNVQEWTSSDYAAYPGGQPSPYWKGQPMKVVRGGSFATPASAVRGSFRNFYSPDARDDSIGFRCVKDVPH